MTREELFEDIDIMLSDTMFYIGDKIGSICPFARDNISLCYDGESVDGVDLKDFMTTPFIEGKTLDEMFEVIEDWN